MEHPPEAIVFDLDGVIVDSEPLHAEALTSVCAPYDVPFDGPRFVGWADADALRQAFADAGRSTSQSMLTEMLIRKNQRLLDSLRMGRIRAYPGVVNLLRALRAEGMPLGLCSAALRREIDPTLETLGLADVFHVVVACEDAARTKPFADPYLFAADRLSASPGRCIAVEDSPHGVASAKDAGFIVYALGHTTRPEHLGRADHIRPTIGALAPELIAMADRSRKATSGG